MRRLTPVLALWLLSASIVAAYHVGEKPYPPLLDDAGTPRILRISQTDLEFSALTDGPVTLRISDTRGNLLSNNGRLYTETEAINGKGHFSLDLADLQSGVYFIVLSNSAGVSATGVVEVE